MDDLISRQAATVQPENARKRTETHACDLISRKAAIDAVYKCTDIFINNLPVMIDKADAYKALAELPSAEPQNLQPTCNQIATDYISRKEAIDWIKGWFETDKHYHPHSKGKAIPTCEVMDILERVPSAEPQKMKGKWEECNISDKPIEEWQSARCSKCGKYHTTPYLYSFTEYSFCPNCGAEMDGGQNGKNS